MKIVQFQIRGFKPVRIKLIFFIFVLIVSVLLSSKGYGYSTSVHGRITNSAINSTSLVQKALFDVGLQGIDELVDNKTIREWLVYGSVREDDLDGIRFLNHFYNPLANSGLSDFPFYGVSSLDWASQLNNSWSWRWARDYFYKGLIKPTKSERGQALANSFRSLGQVVHLMQDTASTAHARNDAHPAGDPYEEYTKAKASTLNYTSISLPYSNISVSPYAPKQFWDVDAYTGGSAYDSGYIGLAEYTNANFFSKDTTFKNFPHPARENTNYQDFGLLPITVITTPNNINHNTFYISGYGKRYLAGMKYFAEEIWNSPIPLPIKKYQLMFTLDNRVHDEYSQFLVPRAVGYSAGLLDYFFRGKIDLTLLSSGDIRIANLSSEEMEGDFTLYYDADDGTRKPVPNGTWRLLLLAGADKVVSFTEPDDLGDEGQYILVFRGRLGKETDAVTAKIWSHKYYWSVVVAYPPKSSERYTLTRTDELVGSTPMFDVGRITNTFTDICPNAGHISVYLISHSQPLFNKDVYMGCGDNYYLYYIGERTKAEMLSKIFYQDMKTEVSGYYVVDIPNRIWAAPQFSGEMAYGYDAQPVRTETPFAPLSWEKISNRTSAITKIKSALSIQESIFSAYKAAISGSDYGYIRVQEAVSVTITDAPATHMFFCGSSKNGFMYSYNNQCNSGLVYFEIVDNLGVIYQTKTIKIAIPYFGIEFIPFERKDWKSNGIW